MSKTMNMKVAQEKLNAMKAGSKVVTNDQEMDLMSELDGVTMNRVKSLPNPAQIGTKDSYIAWI